MEFSQSNSNIAYVGMGEPQMWINVSWADGVYPDDDINKMQEPKELITKSPERISMLKYLIREYSWKHFYSGGLAQGIDSMIPKLEAEIYR
ncbi:MAG: hypothetical protein JSV59_14010 [Flavobacteriaceae bacterium]|nr:MAG: hypothetical protein JSV59_14010 [Flavobacteriaceae bacterium]